MVKLAKRNEPLKVICHLSMNGRDGPYKKIDEYSPEEISLFKDRASEKMSKFLSDYFSTRPEEYIEFAKKVTGKTA